MNKPFPLVNKLPEKPGKPYILPLPVPKAKAMTIVAGFQCSDGIVLAADTQISHFQSYSYERRF